MKPSGGHASDPAICALTIAGSDSSGGAGLQADLRTFEAWGVYGASVVTAVTAQNTLGVQGVWPLAPEIVAAQLESVVLDLAPRAIKIGMLGTPEIARAVSAGLARSPCASVLDPVLAASDGRALYTGLGATLLPEQDPLWELVRRVTLVTPNIPEAARLTGRDEEDVRADPGGAAAELGARGARAVLLKGGHGDRNVCIDHLWTPGGSQELRAERLESRNTHGTGCVLSAAIAAALARGAALAEAVRAARAYQTRALHAARSTRLGRGTGPLWPVPRG